MPKGYPKAGRKWPEPTMTPSDTDLAWAAGIMDGEGCIAIKLDSKKPGWTRHELKVDVTNTNEPIIRKLQAMFGGGISIPKSQGPNRRRVAHWQIYGRRAAGCLRAILPYMVAKKPEAVLAIEMADTLVAYADYNANSGQGAPRPSDEVLVRRQEIREELQRLKRVEYTFADFQYFMQGVRSNDPRVETNSSVKGPA
jgi:hypothetical protein